MGQLVCRQVLSDDGDGDFPNSLYPVRGVKEMVVNRRYNHAVQAEAQIRQLQAQGRGLVDEPELFRHTVLNGIDVGQPGCWSGRGSRSTCSASLPRSDRKGQLLRKQSEGGSNLVADAPPRRPAWWRRKGWWPPPPVHRLCWATAKAAAISGTLPSLTRLWASPTRSKENHPTRLARHREEHGGSDAQIELRGDTVAELKQLGQFGASWVFYSARSQWERNCHQSLS